MVAVLALAAFGSPAVGQPGVVSMVNGQVPDPVAAARLDLVPVTLEYDAEGQALQHVVELRRHYGLDSDPDRVREIQANSASEPVYRSGSDIAGGIAFTTTEVDDIDRIARLEWVAMTIDTWAANRFGTDFAGSYLEGGRLTVSCVACDPIHDKEQLVSDNRVDPDLHGLIDFREVHYRLDELRVEEQQVAERLAASGVQYNGTSTDYENNTVAVYSTTEEALAVAQAATSLHLAFVLEEQEHREQVDKDQAIAYALVEGGQWISAPGLGECTSGYAVNSGFGPMIMTAGHCLAVGGPIWSQGSATLGPAVNRHRYGNFDAGVISIYGYRNPWGRFHWNSTSWDAVLLGINSSNLTGYTVCSSGAITTGMSGDLYSTSRCGEVDRLDFRPSGTGDDGQLWGSTFLLATYRATGRDSGATIHWPSYVGRYGVAIHRGGPDGVGLHEASRFSVIAAEWGVTLAAS